VRRGLEAEGDRVADVEISHARAGRFHLLGLLDDVTDGVGETADAGSDGNGGVSFGDCHPEILSDGGRKRLETVSKPGF
jgi:hypothetical protein